MNSHWYFDTVGWITGRAYVYAFASGSLNFAFWKREEENQPANSGLPGKFLFEQCVCIRYSCCRILVVRSPDARVVMNLCLF